MFDKKAAIENLIKVADTLDQLGMEADADYITSIIEKLAQDAGSAPVEADSATETSDVVNVEEGSSENIEINMSDDKSVEDFEKKVYSTLIENLQKEFEQE